MEEKQFYQLLKKYRTGEATAEEIGLLHAYYDLFDSQPDGLANMHDKKAESLKDDIKAGIDKRLDVSEKKSRLRPPYFRLLWVAASVAALAAVGAVIGNRMAHEPLAEKFARFDVKPGRKNVTLTLANGSKLIIRPNTTGQLTTQGSTILAQKNAGLLVYTAASTANSNPITQYNTISIPDGTEFEVILPDGSKAFLNANSSLKYPTVFNGGTRQVELQGEGYFEVTHNKEKPFIVQTARQTVLVLGTHFNINAYADERTTKTTLLEGRVQIMAGPQAFTLIPGEQAMVTNNGSPLREGMIMNADTDQAVAWKNGFFQYHEADIKAIMRDFSRWYGVKVIYDGNIHERLFSGAIHKDLSLLQALDLLGYANVHFTIENKQITISNN